MTNYYQLLGVERGASEEAIRNRFRVLAREAHPDRFIDPVKKRDAEEKFQLLTEAVNVLTNEGRRKTHDFDLDRGNEGAKHDPQAVAKVYLAKGVKAYKDGDFPSALMLFDMSVKHYDQDAKAFHYLAMACLKVAPVNVRRGTEAITAAIKLEAHNGAIHRDAGKLYAAAGLVAKAERHFEEALKWMPEDAETRRILAEIKSGSESKNLLGSIFGRKG
ncbi:MAG: DnaJ domain-containing protein [Thermoanaerobaculia bacterium]